MPSIPQRVMTNYNFGTNDPFDRSAPVRMVLDRLLDSRGYMDSIRSFSVPPDGLAVWFFGQNGFILKAGQGPLIGIDLYLTDSCAKRFRELPFRVNRQLPIFIEPEDLDVDVFLTTHSHDDHADPETIRRFARKRSAAFIGPWQSIQRYEECGVPSESCHLLHPAQELELDSSTKIRGTFALPTDNTDLNHLGVLLEFANGITFYNTGDTAYCELLKGLLPRNPDVCTICINGGFHNLSHMQAAELIATIQPKVAIPCHYDMMINNVGHPQMLEASLRVLGSDVGVRILPYYEPWVYVRHA